MRDVPGFPPTIAGVLRGSLHSRASWHVLPLPARLPPAARPTLRGPPRALAPVPPSPIPNSQAPRDLAPGFVEARFRRAKAARVPHAHVKVLLGAARIPLPVCGFHGPSQTGLSLVLADALEGAPDF